MAVERNMDSQILTTVGADCDGAVHSKDLLGCVERMPIRYYGGKWRLADWIIPMMPKHGHYVEPCGGGASVLLQKPRALVETYNDIEGEVVNFFRVLRDRPSEVIRVIKLTPWAREEYETRLEPATDEIERARRFWMRSWMSIGASNKADGFRVSKDAASQPARMLLEIDYLNAVAERLRGVQIERLDALECIERYDGDDTLIYFDPPYITETRSHKNQYVHECGDDWHRHAAELLRKVKAHVIVSGYACPLYAEIFEGWERKDRETLCNSAQTRTESVWLNPRTTKERGEWLW